LKKQIFCVFKSQFLKTQFPNELCSAIWFKIALIVYEIAIPNTPLVSEIRVVVYGRNILFVFLEFILIHQISNNKYFGIIEFEIF